MCGISGVLNPREDSNVLDLIKMTAIIQHRGPDDEGYVLFNHPSNASECYLGNDTPSTPNGEMFSYNPSEPIESAEDKKFDIGFGHRRLSILDLSPHGHQPMCDASGNFWITYNGEVYNYLELKAELEQLGHMFRTQTDTEVILAAYIEWGLNCQGKFNGMWAFAIYNKLDRTIFMSRDRFGIKPLYYWFSPSGNFYFGSEIKQFTVLKDWDARVNYPRVYDYLFYALTDHTDETMFSGVFHLPPGTYIHTNLNNIVAHSTGKLNHERWYKPVFKGYTGSFEEAKTEFTNRFKSAIEMHLRSDVPVGSALSGGLDSSAIVCYVNTLLRNQKKEELQKTFSSCSEDKRYDEKIWMDEVVKHTEVEAHFVFPKGENVFNLSEKLIWHQDEPYQSQSAFLGYHVFEKAKQKGVKVLLNGQGADEYLSGYNAYLGLRLRNLFKSWHFKSFFKELGFQSLSKKVIASVRFLSPDIPGFIKDYLSTFSSDFKIQKRLFSSGQISRRGAHPFKLIPYKNNSAFEIAHHQLLYQPLQKYLRWEDRNSMAHSVEARVPFLDHRLVEFTTQLPLHYLDGMNDSKKILTHSLINILPEVIRNRKDKKGFITPEKRWFMEDFKTEFLELFEQNIHYAQGIINADTARKYLKLVQNGTLTFDYTYWRIICFCLWMKVFKVKS